MAKRIKPGQLDRLWELREKSKAMAADKKAIDDEIKLIEAEAAEDLSESKSGKASRGDYRLSWTEKAKSVSWKSVFIKECGAEKASKLVKDAGVKKMLVILRVKDSE